MRWSIKRRPAEPDVQHHGSDAEQPELAAMVDRLAREVMLRYASGRRALDLGMGRPEVTTWVEQAAAHVERVGATELSHSLAAPGPTLAFAAGSFELVYALNTLPYLGSDQHESDAMVVALLAEIERVSASGGTAVVEIFNPYSFTGVAVGLRRPSALFRKRPLVVVDPHGGVTRLDSVAQLERMLPSGLRVAGVFGVRVAALVPHLLRLRWLEPALEHIERQLRDSSPLRGFGSHLLVELRRD